MRSIATALRAAPVQWKRCVCSRSAPEHEIHLLGCILLMVWAGLRFADAQRTCPSSLLRDRHVLRGEHWRTKVSGSRQPFGALPFGFSGRPPCWGWDHVCFDALRSWHSRMVSRGGQNLVIDYPNQHLVYNDELPTVVAAHKEFPHSNDVFLTSPAHTTDA